MQDKRESQERPQDVIQDYKYAAVVFIEGLSSYAEVSNGPKRNKNLQNPQIIAVLLKCFKFLIYEVFLKEKHTFFIEALNPLCIFYLIVLF